MKLLIKLNRIFLPHELAEGFVVGEFPVVFLCEGMINILQTPLLCQLGRVLLLHWLLGRTHQSNEKRPDTNKDRRTVDVFDQRSLPWLFPPDCCPAPRHLFSSSWFSSPSFLYVSSFSFSHQIHSRWRHCRSSRRSLSLCPSLSLHCCPERGRWCMK